MNEEERRCHECGGPMAVGTTTYCEPCDGGVLLFEHVPALICQQCGNAVVRGAAAATIERIVKNRTEPTHVLQAWTYDLSGLPDAAGAHSASPRLEADLLQVESREPSSIDGESRISTQSERRG